MSYYDDMCFSELQDVVLAVNSVECDTDTDIAKIKYLIARAKYQEALEAIDKSEYKPIYTDLVDKINILIQSVDVDLDIPLLEEDE